MSGRGGLTAIKRLMNEYKGKHILLLFSFIDDKLEINVNPPDGIFAGIYPKSAN
jgi:hypothetical protein